MKILFLFAKLFSLFYLLKSLIAVEIRNFPSRVLSMRKKMCHTILIILYTYVARLNVKSVMEKLSTNYDR